MTTEQRIQLAYFCVARIAEIDPRVGKPIDVVVLTRNGLKEYTAAELEPFIRQDGVIWGQTKQFFLGDLMLSISN